jgi:hypothetical protein
MDDLTGQDFYVYEDGMKQVAASRTCVQEAAI